MLLSTRGIGKAYSGNWVLRDISLDFPAGQIHALLGENGAGKSTLAKILSGFQLPDAGQLFLEDREVAWRQPVEAQTQGISLIPQELSLAHHLSVWENIFLGIEESRHGLLCDAPARRRCADLIEEYGLDFSPRERVANLLPSQKQQVEILRALVRAQKVLILDESTAYFSEHESRRLFETMKELRRRGLCLIFVTHRLEELEGLADWITVLRDGACVTSLPFAEISLSGILELMVGVAVERVFPPRTRRAAEVLLELRRVTLPGTLSDVSFQVRRGEIFGLGGFVGSRRTALAELLFGLRPGYEGEVLLEGRSVHIDQPCQALDLGISFLTEDRKATGIFPHLGVLENVSVLSLDRFLRHFLIRDGALRGQTAQTLRRLDVRCRNLEQPILELSGGNQQKCVLGRWLMRAPSLLILDEPTRGVDMGARVELYRWFDHLAAQGMAILLISSDLRELEGIADRVAVFREGQMVGLLEGDQVSRSEIVRLAALGETGEMAGARIRRA